MIVAGCAAQCVCAVIRSVWRYRLHPASKYWRFPFKIPKNGADISKRVVGKHASRRSWQSTSPTPGAGKIADVEGRTTGVCPDLPYSGKYALSLAARVVNVLLIGRKMCSGGRKPMKLGTLEMDAGACRLYSHRRSRVGLLQRQKSHTAWPKSWAKFTPLIGILSQNTGPSRAILANL